MLELSGYNNLATSSRQNPAGLAEAMTITRKDSLPASEKESGVTGNLAPSNAQFKTVTDQASLETTANQRVNDLSGTSAKSRRDATNNGEDSVEQQQQQAKVDQVISQLKARDMEVRAHEQAHLAVAGQYATGLSYSYQTGPDGKQYAIGGEVGIDTSAIPGDPEATIQKAQVVQNAAMAPAEPSSQDFRVASTANQMMAQARAELSSQDENSEQSTDAIEATESSSNQSKDPLQNQLSDQQANPASISTNDYRFGPEMISERAAFETRLQMPKGQELVADLVNP